MASASFGHQTRRILRRLLWCPMLLMFVIGSANIGWMLALGAVMVG
jgi:hypothetical protein